MASLGNENFSDVRRSYTRVEINYDGWVSSAEQVRYDKLCNTFARLADAVVHDEIRTQELMEWIENQLTHSSNIVPHITAPNVPPTSEVVPNQLAPIFEPKCSKRKGALRKNRQKGPLEKTSNKTKVSSSTNKRTRKVKGNVADNHPATVVEPEQ